MIDVLLVEDDHTLSGSLADYLTEVGLRLISLLTGKRVWNALCNNVMTLL